MNGDNATALFIVSFRGHLDILHLLIDRGADLEISTTTLPTPAGPRTLTALFMAALCGKVEICQVLLDNGAIINEDNIEIIGSHPECQEIIINEIENRQRRVAFDNLINNHIEYQLYKDQIYSRCFPTGDIRVATPPIGWPRAYLIMNKYYYDEILFYVHLYVANDQAKKDPNDNDNITSYLSNNNSNTSTLMRILSDRLILYLTLM